MSLVFQIMAVGLFELAWWHVISRDLPRASFTRQVYALGYFASFGAVCVLILAACSATGQTTPFINAIALATVGAVSLLFAFVVWTYRHRSRPLAA